MSRNITKILCASDLSVFSSHMLRYAISIAESENASITLFHAIEPLGVLADAMLETYIPQDFMGQVKTKGMPSIIEAIRQQVIESVAEECESLNIPPVLIDDILVEVGTAEDVILKAIKEHKIDLLLCGSGGQDEKNPTPLGSTASKLLQLSPVPVLMVPYSQQAKEPQKAANSSF